MDPRKDDRQLLLAIGGVILAGAAGIALIAGLSSSGEDTPETTVARKPAPTRATSPAIPAHGSRKQPAPVPAAFPMTESTNAEASSETSSDVTGTDTGEVDSIAETITESTPAFEIDPTADFLAEGQRAYAKREFDRAAAYLDAAVEANPSASWPRYMLGLAQWKSGDLDAAAENLRVAGDMNGRTLRPWINLARVENERGEFGAALEACERALAVDPDDPVAVYQRARSLRHLGRVDEAIDECRRSLSYDAEYGDALNLLGLMLIEAGRFDEAVDPLQRASRHAADVAYVHNNLGVALERSGDLFGAAVAYRRVVELEGEAGKGSISLARVESLLPAGEADPVAVAEGGETSPPVASPADDTVSVDEEPLVEVSPDDVTVASGDSGKTESDVAEDAGSETEGESGGVE